jgi:hypothetical protein
MNQNRSKRRTLKLYQIVISKTRFDTIREPERILFIRCGHCLDEINSLLRMFLWSSRLENVQAEERDARLAQGSVVARVLTGKLYETYKWMERDYFGNVSKKYDPFLDNSARDALQNLKRYFGKGSNLIRAIRTQYGFHYLDKNKKVAKCLKKIPSEDNFVFYFAEDSRNSFYCSADVIVKDAMLEDIEPERADQAQERLEKETIMVTGWLTTLLNWYLYTVMAENVGKSFREMGAKEIRIKRHGG